MVTVVKKKVFDINCKECESDLRYEYDDIFKKKVMDYTGSSETLEFIKCPVCQHDVCVKTY